MLDHGQQISNDLAGMRQVGQPVDHRHRGMGGEFLDLGMIVGADHNRIDHAAQNPGGICNRLAAPQLH